MPIYMTQSEIDIKRPALDIYHFVTVPDNWVGSHPATAGVFDAGCGTGTSMGVGKKWGEHIATPISKLDAVWECTAAEPGKKWQIKADIKEQSAVIIITYLLEEKAGVTHFIRHMRTDVPTGFKPKPEDIQGYTLPDMQDAYLAKLKEMFERK